MPNRVHLGNLSYETTENEIYDLFNGYDVASVDFIADRDTGRFKGFAFVNFNNEEDAQKAIDDLHNSEFKGRPISVSFAKDRDTGGNRGGNDSAPSYGRYSSRDKDPDGGKPYQKRGDRNSGSGGGGNGCYNCGKSGHFSRECPNKKEDVVGGRGGRGNACFKCGEEGHFSRECPSGDIGGRGGDNKGRGGSSTSGRGCFNCGEETLFERMSKGN